MDRVYEVEPPVSRRDFREPLSGIDSAYGRRADRRDRSAAPADRDTADSAYFVTGAFGPSSADIGSAYGRRAETDNRRFPRPSRIGRLRRPIATPRIPPTS